MRPPQPGGTTTCYEWSGIFYHSEGAGRLSPVIDDARGPICTLASKPLMVQVADGAY